jgi:peptidoglycan hydrolase CwlO-like protein
MDKVKLIFKIVLVLLLLPVIALIYLAGKDKLLKLLLDSNNKEQEELKQQQELVDKAIDDLNKGIDKLKTSPTDNPSDVENFHKKYSDERNK